MRGCGKVLVWLRQAQSPGFVNYVRRPLVCAQPPDFDYAQSPGRKILYCYLSFEITTEGAL